MASAPRSIRSKAEQAVLLFGLLGALALLAAAFLDSSNLEERAATRLSAGAGTIAQIATQRWEGLRKDRDLPKKSILGEFLIPAEPEPGVGQPEDPAEDPLQALLLHSAEAALLRREVGAALSTARQVLDSNAGPALKARAHFVSLRGWSELEDPALVRFHRDALLATLADPRVEGTSIKLLALMVEPIDPERARAGLLSGEFTLPAPKDALRVRRDELELIWDPWWKAIASQLGMDHTEQDSAEVWREDQRIQDQLAAKIREQRSEFPEEWVFLRIEGGTFGIRPELKSLRVAWVDEATLVQELWDFVPPPGRGGFQLGGQVLDHHVWSTTHTLAEAPFRISVRHPDPWADLRSEQARRLGLRLGLGALALGVVASALVAARSMARARKLDALRRTFVASVSHDLRTPTQSVLLLAETLEQGRIATPEGRGRYVTGIRREAQRMRRLVEDLLDVARLERGEGARIERRPVDMESFLNELESAMEERASEAGARLELIRGSLPAQLHLDADSVHRSIWNLFENALRHGRWPDREPEVTVEVDGNERELVVTVIDSGPGIPARFASKAFEPFERLHSAKDLNADTGTGLGLSIVRALTRAHGGDVELGARPDRKDGARFRARFATGESGSTPGEENAA